MVIYQSEMVNYNYFLLNYEIFLKDAYFICLFKYTSVYLYVQIIDFNFNYDL